VLHHGHRLLRYLFSAWGMLGQKGKARRKGVLFFIALYFKNSILKMTLCHTLHKFILLVCTPIGFGGARSNYSEGKPSFLWWKSAVFFKENLSAHARNGVRHLPA